MKALHHLERSKFRGQGVLFTFNITETAIRLNVIGYYLLNFGTPVGSTGAIG